MAQQFREASNATFWLNSSDLVIVPQSSCPHPTAPPINDSCQQAGHADGFTLGQRHHQPLWASPMEPES